MTIETKISNPLPLCAMRGEGRGEVSIPLNRLRAGVPRRQDGYIAACLLIGQLDAASQSIIFTEEQFQTIKQTFRKKRGIQVVNPGCC